MFKIIPNVKIIIVLRNPIDRAYSHYHDLGVRLGKEKRTFDDAIQSELKILEEKNYVITDYDGDFTDRLYQYVTRGIYLDHLKIWMETFPKKQFLILKTEDLENNPVPLRWALIDFDQFGFYLKKILEINSDQPAYCEGFWDLRFFWRGILYLKPALKPGKNPKFAQKTQK